MFLGNILPDKELINLTNKNDKELRSEILELYKKKRSESIKLIGEEKYLDLEKKIFLQILDFSWRSHLQYLEQLRQVIGLRSYGQRDPLIEYKKEAFELFSNLLDKLKLDFITILMNLKVVEEPKKTSKEIKPAKINPKYIGKKMSRNEPCLCGSGKKFKHCCGAL